MKDLKSVVLRLELVDECSGIEDGSLIRLPQLAIPTNGRARAPQ